MSDILKRLSNQPPFPSGDDKENAAQEESVQQKEGDITGEKEENRKDNTDDQEAKTVEVSTTEEKQHDDELPQEVKERTKQQFEKLKENNKKLSEELQRYKNKDVLSSLYPEIPDISDKPYAQYFEKALTNTPPPKSDYPNLSQEQINEVFNRLVDDQGYVDVALLREELEKRQRKEKQLEEEIARLRETVNETKRSVEEYQRSEYMKAVHKKYPEIDPTSPQFNGHMWEAVRNEILGQWITQGKEDVESACEKWRAILYPKKGNEDEEMERKMQINAIPTRSSSTATDWGDEEYLIEAVRKGKKGALRERLRRAGY